MPAPVTNWRKLSKSRSVWLAEARPDGAFDGRRDHPPGEQPVEANAGARQHARAHGVEAGQRDERHSSTSVSMTSVTWLALEITRS